MQQPPRRSGALPGAFLIAWFAADLAVAEPAASPLWVNCYEETREIVRRTRAGECQGRPVGDAEAAAIAERRRAYIQQAIEEPVTASGKRLKKMGSGFFVGAAGLLLTNYHIVHDCSALTVSPAWGNTLEATLLALDVADDLALIETGFAPPRVAVFAPPEDPVPPRMAVVGYPTRGVPSVRPILASATPLHPRSSPPGAGPLAIRGDVRPGNSGGPLLDPSGRVVGVVFGAVDTPSTYRQTRRIVRDIGVALTGRAALSFLERNGVAPLYGDPKEDLADLLEQARGFVARVECWD